MALQDGSKVSNTTGKTINVGVATLFHKPGVEIPQILKQETANLHLEEWLHALQHLRGGAIAGFKDSEADVACYMQNHGVPLTDYFWERYESRKLVRRANK